MTGYLLVAVGGALGAVTRYLADRFVQSRHSSPFPFGILLVNLVGSITLGVLTGALLAGSDLMLLVGTGFCGALTTYSTLSWETVELWERGHRRSAVLNLVVSIVAGLGAAALGYWVGAAYFR